MKKRPSVSTLVILISSLFLVGIVFYNFIRTDDVGTPSRSIVESVFSTPSPTPVPFRELTIPYLRGRDYLSSLGNRTTYSQTPTYTSYLTSYDSDGHTVNGLLTIPKESEPAGGWPAIVFVHGYIPPSLYQTTQKYEAYVDYLARNGFVVFKIDLRGHGDSEGVASGAYYSGDYVIDTLNAVSALQTSDFVNPEKIGLWGHSMAGNVTFRAFVANQNIKALVIWAGAVYTYDDLAEFRIQDTSYRPPTDNTERQRYRDELLATQGNYDKESEFWKMVVPTNYLDGVEGAIQVHHAIDDSVVSIGYSRNLNSILDTTMIAHELFEYTAGGHNISGTNFSLAMQRSVGFFTNKLKN